MIDLAKEPTPVSPAVKEDFMTSKWRPMMAISYMAICLFDFMVGPILYNVLQYMNPGQHLEMWQAVTLQGGGLYHLSMGAIIGITAFGRTKEKMAEAKE
jgi:fucose 4-O-acetylase-like acetyltransferase